MLRRIHIEVPAKCHNFRYPVTLRLCCAPLSICRYCLRCGRRGWCRLLGIRRRGCCCRSGSSCQPSLLCVDLCLGFVNLPLESVKLCLFFRRQRTVAVCLGGVHNGLLLQHGGISSLFQCHLYTSYFLFLFI